MSKIDGCWVLTNRHGGPIAAGTLEQMLAHLRFTAKDGEYTLVHDEVSIPTLRHCGILYPFDQWKGFRPIETIDQPRVQS
jgi:hypothetical protein